MDLARKVQFFTLDVISSLASQKPFGFLEQDADVNQYIEMVERSMPSMITLSLFPGLTKILQSRFFRWTMPSDQDLVGFGHFIGYVLRRHPT